MGDENYAVVDGDWLLKVARIKGYLTEQPILAANPALLDSLAGNPNVLPIAKTIVIPGKHQKSENATTDAFNSYQVAKPSKALRITLRDQLGNKLRSQTENSPIKGWTTTLMVGGESVDLEPADDGSLTLPNYKLDALTATLRIVIYGPNDFAITQDIDLRVGWLNAPQGKSAFRSLKRILANLGCYDAVEFDDDFTLAVYHAIGMFQNVSGEEKPDGDLFATAWDAILKASGDTFAREDLPPGYVGQKGYVAPFDRVRVLDVGKNASAAMTQRIWPTSTYFEPRDPDRLHPREVGTFDLYSKHVYVAPADKGSEGLSSNSLRMRQRRFVFLDTGRWLRKKPRNFGIVWGSHAYLCDYRPLEKRPSDLDYWLYRSDRFPDHPSTPRALDTMFFAHMGDRVSIVNRASATWAPEGDFEWDRIWIVVPDLHLMSGPVGKYWYETDYNLQSQIDLLQFVEDLVSLPVRKAINFVQIGDSYDLWVGRECLFTQNDQRKVELKAPEDVVKLVEWIADIRGLYGSNGVIRPETAPVTDPNWVKQDLEKYHPEYVDRLKAKLAVSGQPNVWLSPAEAAMRLAESQLSTTYIYGNHDNYLSIPSVCKDAGLRQRQAHIMRNGLHIEHAHRMEDLFHSSTPANYDGETSGHRLTNLVYDARSGGPTSTAVNVLNNFLTGPINAYFHDARYMADVGDEVSEWLAESHDQPVYWSEFGRIRLGREVNGVDKLPHIFVIGHTHKPKLLYVDINKGLEGEPAP